MLPQAAKRTYNDLTHPTFIRQMVWVAALWVVAIIIILLNIEFLKTNFPNPVRPDDLILDIIPETEAFIGIGETFSALQVLVMAVILYQQRFKGLPKLLFLLAMMYILRAFTLNLTPLAQIQPPSENYAESHIIAQMFYHGMFFSGHTASAFIQAFFVKHHRLRSVVFILASAQAFSLLASHSHYSIDVFGGFFVAYFMTHFDFMRLVPGRFRNVRWLPWAADDDTEQESHLQRQANAVVEQAIQKAEAIEQPEKTH